MTEALRETERVEKRKVKIKIQKRRKVIKLSVLGKV